MMNAVLLRMQCQVMSCQVLHEYSLGNLPLGYQLRANTKSAIRAISGGIWLSLNVASYIMCVLPRTTAAHPPCHHYTTVHTKLHVAIINSMCFGCDPGGYQLCT